MCSLKKHIQCNSQLDARRLQHVVGIYLPMSQLHLRHLSSICGVSGTVVRCEYKYDVNAQGSMHMYLRADIVPCSVMFLLSRSCVVCRDVFFSSRPGFYSVAHCLTFRLRIVRPPWIRCEPASVTYSSVTWLCCFASFLPKAALRVNE